MEKTLIIHRMSKFWIKKGDLVSLKTGPTFRLYLILTDPTVVFAGTDKRLVFDALFWNGSSKETWRVVKRVHFLSRRPIDMRVEVSLPEDP